MKMATDEPEEDGKVDQLTPDAGTRLRANIINAGANLLRPSRKARCNCRAYIFRSLTARFPIVDLPRHLPLQASIDHVLVFSHLQLQVIKCSSKFDILMTFAILHILLNSA